MDLTERIRSYRLSSRMKQTIQSVIIWGIIAHLYMYTNRIVNHDAVWKLTYSGATITSGRWFLEVLVEISRKFHNNYVTPLGIGVVTILLYAACACVLVKLFDIRSKRLCWILGAIFITYPTITSNNLYIFTAHYYAFAFLLACGSVLLLTVIRKPIAIAGSALLIALSLGIYQAYIPSVLAMYVLLILLNCLRREAATADIIRTALRFLAALLCGMVVYFLANRCALRLSGQQMDTYMGLDSMGKLSISAIPSILKKCYTSFFDLFLNKYHGINDKPWIRILMLLCFVYSLAAIAWMIRKNRICPVHIAFVVLAVILLPVAIGGIYIMTQVEKAICTMTVFATIFIFIIPICITDRLLDGMNINKAFWVEVCLCAALIFVPTYYASLANETYLSLEYSNQNINAYFTELATQIKSLDGFSTDLKVALIGEVQDESIPEIDCDYIIRGTFTPRDLVNVYSREHFMAMHCGYSCEFVKDTDSLANDARVRAMPTYPSKGAICIIDDVIVVKFS